MTLYDARRDLMELVDEAGYSAQPYGKEVVLAPVVQVRAGNGGSNYLEPGDTFLPEEMIVNFDLILLIKWGLSEVAQQEMDTMISDILLNLGDWQLSNLTGHEKVALAESGPIYLGSTISVTNYINLKEAI